MFSYIINKRLLQKIFILISVLVITIEISVICSSTLKECWGKKIITSQVIEQDNIPFIKNTIWEN